VAALLRIVADYYDDDEDTAWHGIIYDRDKLDEHGTMTEIILDNASLLQEILKTLADVIEAFAIAPATRSRRPAAKSRSVEDPVLAPLTAHKALMPRLQRYLAPPIHIRWMGRNTIAASPLPCDMPTGR
jgi:hypothetical protein